MKLTQGTNPNEAETRNIAVSALDGDGEGISLAEEIVDFQDVSDEGHEEHGEEHGEAQRIEGRSITSTPAATVSIQTVTSQLNSVVVSWTANNAIALQMEFNGGAAQGISGTSRTFTGLASGTAHPFRIRGQNSAGTWGSWASRSLTTLSAAPTEIPATSTHNSISVRILPTFPVGATGYQVECNGAIHTAIRDRNAFGTLLNSWTCIVSNLDPCREYTYRVRSTNAGGEGPFSPIHRIRTLLESPGNLRITSRSTTEMTLQWDASVRATSYAVTFAGETFPAANSLSRVVRNLDPGVNYAFSVVARNSFGDSRPSSGAGMTLSLPPTTITATPAVNSVGIQWDRPVGANNFEIEFDGAIRRTGNTQSHTVPNLLPNTSYSYRIRSLNTGGTGAYSPWQTVRTLLAAPLNVRVVSATTTTITLQ